ncbi:MAG TPA: hypothetical protein VI248_28330 [Kineosporiaceae bacterium]
MMLSEQGARGLTPGWLTGVAASVVTRHDATSHVVVTLVAALVFTGWVITSDLRTNRLRSLILAVMVRRDRSGAGADEPETEGRATEIGEPSSESRKEGSWAGLVRRRRG